MDAPSERERRFYAIADESSPCDHDAVEGLDGSGAGRFFRCRDCGSVLVREGPRREIGGRSDDLDDLDPRLDDLLDDIEAHHAGERTSFTEGRPRGLAGRVADACRRLLG